MTTGTIADHARALRCASWLGWQLDSNWANPWLFVLYVLVKPVCGSLLLVCMYWAARAAGGGAPEFLAFVYVSSACFLLVAGVACGMSQAVVADRESYGMLKFVRISPVSLRTYLVGRGLSRAGQAAVGAVVTLLLGLALFPELRAALAEPGVAVGWLLVHLVLGLAMLVALGLILAGALLNMGRYGMFLGEGVAGTLYLLSGAVFPLDVLPPWLRPLGLALPPTYWLEGMRRALLGPGESHSPLGAWSQPQLALLLAAGTVALWVVADRFFRWGERRAWRLGRFDEHSDS